MTDKMTENKPENKTDIQLNNSLKEQISALVDGEVQFNELDGVLQQLRTEQAKEDWALYHQIGELINSEDLSINLNQKFMSNLQAKLASEPAYIRPKTKAPISLRQKTTYTVTYAVACTVALILFMIPEFAGNDDTPSSALFSDNPTALAVHRQQPDSAIATLASASRANPVPTQPTDLQPDMVRDPDIDRLLAAHQRYSTSMYSAVEYETSPIVQETGR